ncbi:hypothetical protein BUALT_Bualt07G0055800 [Buddleja alternifolia]|uniref:chalcone synthase n=1 Tax=Buddleja alternifolia TaxID=168488 RepID=A0AAV6XGF8_9LAMI|nr:hypothetical protein BUALT_Bualt07G0055800 [Buddleja alternifolia]
MVSLEEIRRSQRAQGPATIMAIGTATPPNQVNQSTYPDYYFRVTNSEHMTDLKEKFKVICEKTMIKKRHMYLTEEILKENPKLCAHDAPSLDKRQAIAVVEVPKLGKEAALKAIEEWGQPKSKITHLIFCTSGCVDMPGADYQLAKLLDLPASVNRFILYLTGCNGGGTSLRLAKDLAENNRGARVLVVCSEMGVIAFRGPSEAHLDSLVEEALFGDGASAIIVGSDPIVGVERPLFELFSATQSIVPNSGDALNAHLHGIGLRVELSKHVPHLISTNIEQCLIKAFKPLGISDWNSIFWATHPGGARILARIESELSLKPEKLRRSWDVLSEYGNISSACVFFVLDEIRRSSAEEGRSTTGEGLEWGVLFGFGPGLTVETIVLRSIAI